MAGRETDGRGTQDEYKPAHISVSKFYGIWKDEDFPELSSDDLTKQWRSQDKGKIQWQVFSYVIVLIY